MSPRNRAGAFLIAAALGVGLSAALPAPARAQGGLLPFRFKVGGLFATDSDVRDFVGSPLWAAEVDFDLPSLAGGNRTRLGLGYYERRSSGNAFRAVPFTVSQIFSPPNPASATTGNVYFGFGGGLYYLQRSGFRGKTSTNLGLQGIAGYQFPKRVLGFVDFIEGKYHYTFGGANGLSPNGLTVMLGYRL
jgi:hypothetical protein